MDVSNAPTWNKTAKTFGNAGSFKPATKKINMAGKDSFEETITGLEINKAYKVYYVLENSYGSQSLAVASVNLSKAVILEKAGKIDAAQLEFDKDNQKFTWKDAGYAGHDYDYYTITLYKDGKILDEQTKLFYDSQSHEYTLPSELEAGTYYIEVVTVGSITGANNDELNSDAVKSKTVTVKDIAKVSNLKLNTNLTNGYPELSWTENDTNCAGYIVNLYRQDVATGVYTKQAARTYTSVTNNVKKSIYFNTESNAGDNAWNNATNDSYRIDRNYEYLAEVIATPKADIKADEYTIYVNSQPETYNLCAPYREATVTSATDEAVTLTLNLNDSATKIFPYYSSTYAYKKTAEDYSYAVRVYEGTSVATGKDMGTKDVTVSYTYNTDGTVKDTLFTVNGLKANTDYAFKLISKCDGFEGWSKEITGIHTMPRIENLVKGSLDQAKEANSKKFYVANTGVRNPAILYIDGNVYKASTSWAQALQNEFGYLAQFLYTLSVGDTVTIKGNTVDLILNATENAGTAMNLNTNYLEDKIVNLDGTGHERVLTGTVISELHLKNGYFDINALNLADATDSEKDGKIILEDGVRVKVATTNTDLTVEPGTAKINNVAMTTELETTVRTEVSPDAQVLVVVANGQKSNNLTFENIYDSVNADANKNATIKFVSADGNAAVQQGAITIKGEGGKVKVEQENVSVGSSITVTVEKGEVDISEPSLTGAKAVTLSGSETSKVTAIAANAVPKVLKGTTTPVVIKHYNSVEELRKGLGNNASAGYELTDEVVAEVNAWFDTFGITGKGAKIIADTISNKVTIEYTGTETLTVTGLK